MSDESAWKFYTPFSGTVDERAIEDPAEQARLPVITGPWRKEKKNVHGAAGDGDISALQAFLAQGVSVDDQDDEDATPFMNAAAMGQHQAIEFLLRSGADVNAKDLSGMTPLMFAAVHGQREVVKLLLERGADASAKLYDSASYTGETASELARRWGQPEIAKILGEATGRQR